MLIADGPALIRANGLFATTDGLVVTMAPFLGTWLVGVRGLEGVLALDAFSFLLAILLVLMAPWRDVLFGNLLHPLQKLRLAGIRCFRVCGAFGCGDMRQGLRCCSAWW